MNNIYEGEDFIKSIMPIYQRLEKTMLKKVAPEIFKKFERHEDRVKLAAILLGYFSVKMLDDFCLGGKAFNLSEAFEIFARTMSIQLKLRQIDPIDNILSDYEKSDLSFHDFLVERTKDFVEKINTGE